jgi:hypothetical protein
MLIGRTRCRPIDAANFVTRIRSRNKYGAEIDRLSPVFSVNAGNEHLIYDQGLAVWCAWGWNFAGAAL